MPRLTDEEVGQLLRETFTEKEDLLDQLPEATISPVRRRLPVLLAAAAVLAILGGAVSSVGTGHDQVADPGSQQTAPTGPQTIPLSEESSANAGESQNFAADIAGVAIAELVKWERPDAGWSVVKVLGSPYRNAGNAINPGPAQGGFTAQERREIESRAGVPIEWVKNRPTACAQADGTPYVTVGGVSVTKGSIATIGMSMWRGCLDARWLTYRLERAGTSGETWRVTGTVGPVAES